MKIKLAILFVLLCAACPTAKAQTKVVAFGDIGTAESFGFSLPDLNFGLLIEKPIPIFELPHNQFDPELQFSASWSPSNKFATKDGNSAMAKASGIIWLHEYVGFVAGVRYGHTWTSAFSKGGTIGSGGFVLRFYDDEIRLYATHIRQLFEGIDKNGIETSNTRGVEIQPEIKFGRYRIGYKYTIARGLSQGNPACDGTYGPPVTCARDPWLGFSSSARVGFEF